MHSSRHSQLSFLLYCPLSHLQSSHITSSSSFTIIIHHHHSSTTSTSTTSSTSTSSSTSTTSTIICSLLLAQGEVLTDQTKLLLVVYEDKRSKALPSSQARLDGMKVTFYDQCSISFRWDFFCFSSEGIDFHTRNCFLHGKFVGNLIYNRTG